ncbi:MAG: hypothetical protein ACI9MR_004289 [Myxococcota bacterium]
MDSSSPPGGAASKDNAGRALEDPVYVITDPSIAEVDAHPFVTGRAVGETTLTVTAGATSVTCSITVVDAPLVVGPRGAFDLGEAWGHYLAEGTQAAIGPDGRPSFLLRSAGAYDELPDDPVKPFLAGAAAAIATWTGTGFGWEWVTDDFNEAIDGSMYLVDAEGTEFLAHYDAFRGLRVAVWTRPNDATPWRRTQLPVRPDLTRGEEFDPDTPVPTLGTGGVAIAALEQTDDGVKVRYRIAYQLPKGGVDQSQTASNYLRMVWDAFPETDICVGLDREATLSASGELLDVTTVESISKPAFTCTLDEMAWTPAPAPGPDLYLRGYRVGEPWSMVESWPSEEGPTTFEITHTISQDGVYAALWKHAGSGLNTPDKRLHAVILDATYLRHDDPDALGRRIGSDALTPRFTAPLLRSSECRLALDHMAGSFGSRARPHLATGPDTVWTAVEHSDVDLPGTCPIPEDHLQRCSPQLSTAVFSRDDGIYALSAGGTLAIYRSTDCLAFTEIAQQIEFASTERVPLFRADGSLWIFGPDLAPGGGILMFEDPLLDPVGVTTLSPLADRHTTDWGRNYAVHDLGDQVVTLFQRNTTLAMTVWGSDAEPITATGVDLTGPRQVYGLANAVPLPDGSWLVRRRLGAGQRPAEIVRTADFETFEVVLESAPCSVASRRCKSLLLADGRSVFGAIQSTDIPNREMAVLHLFDADGSYADVVEARPHGGIRQGPFGLHEEDDGSISVVMFDNVSYTIPHAGQTHRFESLI